MHPDRPDWRRLDVWYPRDGNRSVTELWLRYDVGSDAQGWFFEFDAAADAVVGVVDPIGEEGPATHRCTTCGVWWRRWLGYAGINDNPFGDDEPVAESWSCLGNACAVCDNAEPSDGVRVLEELAAVDVRDERLNRWGDVRLVEVLREGDDSVVGDGGDPSGLDWLLRQGIAPGQPFRVRITAWWSGGSRSSYEGDHDGPDCHYAVEVLERGEAPADVAADLLHAWWPSFDRWADSDTQAQWRLNNPGYATAAEVLLGQGTKRPTTPTPPEGDVLRMDIWLHGTMVHR